MIADNFELEQPPADDEVDDHECLLMDMNSTDDADATFATAKEAIASNSDDGSNEYVEYHDILKQRRNDSEGTAETEQSFDSSGSNNPHYDAVNTDDDDNASSSQPSQEMKLLLTFLLMVVVGTGMKIFQKLQAIPYVTFAVDTPMHQFCSSF